MSSTPDFGIPYIAGQQAQPEITHNEAISLLQALANGVISRGVNTPPGSPNEGDSYIIGAAPTGDWVGRPNVIAVYFGTAWLFLPGNDNDGDPISMGARQEGLRIYVRDEDVLYLWDGSAWVEFSGGGGREVLTADRTYYVRTDGSDSNDGLTDSPAGAFLTIQKAIDTTAALDMLIYDVTIEVADGTYADQVVLKDTVGAGTVFIIGNTTTPANVLLDVTTSVTADSLIYGPDYKAKYQIEGMRFHSSNDSIAFLVWQQGKNGFLYLTNVDFGRATQAQILNFSSFIQITGNYSISNDAPIHIFGLELGHTRWQSPVDITFNNAPNFSSGFIVLERAGSMYGGNESNFSFSGTVTGRRALLRNNSTFSGSNWVLGELPGDSQEVILDTSVFIDVAGRSQPAQTQTISAGEITFASSNMRIDTEGGAASDNLDTINGGNDGDILILQQVNGARDVIVGHLTGNIRLSGAVNFNLATPVNRLMVQKDSNTNQWYEVSRSINV